METVELMRGELAHLRECEKALLLVRDAALGNMGDPLCDKWLAPCVGSPAEIPGLVQDRMNERRALLAALDAARDEAARLRGALQVLANEISPAMLEEIREVWGNTNARIVEDALADARRVLD